MSKGGIKKIPGGGGAAGGDCIARATYTPPTHRCFYLYPSALF